MFATLPMYVFDKNKDQTLRFWNALTQYFRSVGLNPPAQVILENHEVNKLCLKDVYLMQTCGFPLKYKYSDDLHYLATPHYNFEGCRGPYYRSFFIASESSRQLNLKDYAHAKIGYSEPDSHSGYNALLYSLSRSGVDINQPDFICTGSHMNSVKMVAGKDIDLACIDCVSWHWIQKESPDIATQVTVIEHTEPAPGLPFVTSANLAPKVLAELTAALLSALDNNDVRYAAQTIGITGISALPFKEYDIISKMRNYYASNDKSHI